METGMIVKALSGFYYVQNENGIVQCRGRGVFRKRKVTPLVGDSVKFAAENRTDGYILEIFERKNELVRPPIANVDQAILVFSAAEPEFSPLLLDRFLVQIENAGLDAIIVISKIDLLEKEQAESLEQYKARYEQIGYTVLLTTVEEEETIEQLLPYINDKVSVIAGQSGVGKSSLLNSIKPELQLETNEISTHLGRGKHTTRHVELIAVGEGLMADTPGFSSLDFTNMEAEQLSDCFPEFSQRANDCKFRGCLHKAEPNCAIKQAVEAGEVSEERLQHYYIFLEEIQNQKRRYDS